MLSRTPLHVWICLKSVLEPLAELVCEDLGIIQTQTNAYLLQQAFNMLGYAARAALLIGGPRCLLSVWTRAHRERRYNVKDVVQLCQQWQLVVAY